MFKIRCLGKLYRNKLDPSLKKKQKISISICIENFLKNSIASEIWGKKSHFNTYSFTLFESFIMLMCYIFHWLLFKQKITDTRRSRAVGKECLL